MRSPTPIAVTNYLRGRFDQDKVYLVGQSWGSILGVLAVQQRPDLFHAVVGSGQVVSPRETDRISYRDTLAWAEETGKTALVSTLTASGPPPYDSILDYEPALTHEMEVYPYDHSGNAEGAGQMGEGLLVGEYSLLDKAHAFAGFLDTFAILYPQPQGTTSARTSRASRSPSISSRAAMRPPAAPSAPRSGSPRSTLPRSRGPSRTPPGTAPSGSNPRSSTPS